MGLVVGWLSVRHRSRDNKWRGCYRVGGWCYACRSLFWENRICAPSSADEKYVHRSEANLYTILADISSNGTTVYTRACMPVWS